MVDMRREPVAITTREDGFYQAGRPCKSQTFSYIVYRQEGESCQRTKGALQRHDCSAMIRHQPWGVVGYRAGGGNARSVHEPVDGTDEALAAIQGM